MCIRDSSSDAGFWNIRIVADYENVIEESTEVNNALEWFKIHDSYFNLAEQRPDLIVAGNNEGTDKVYQNDERIITVAITQTSMGDAMAEEVEVYLKMVDPDLQSTDWFKIDESKTVGLTPETTFFEYAFTPVSYTHLTLPTKA